MVRIIIFEKSFERMNVMFELFISMLDTKVTKSYITRDMAIIKTLTHEIVFMYASNIYGEYQSLRGYKADIVINNTMNPHIDEMARHTMTINSKFYERLKI